MRACLESWFEAYWQRGPADLTKIAGRKSPNRSELAVEEEQYLTPQMIRDLVAYLETLQVP